MLLNQFENDALLIVDQIDIFGTNNILRILFSR